jgi:DNA replication ATP-dependent helicase Dna2
MNKDVVRRILAARYHPTPDSAGPSWLTVLGHAKDSLWSLDLSRCESAILHTHWVLVMMDQCTRRIVGFGVHRGVVDGVALCQMFNRAIGRQPAPTQMDVAHAILPLCTIAPQGSIVLAGDWKQLPPIHQAESPIGLEAMLGPSYLFFRDVHHVGEDMLEENYRSAEEIVTFCREAGYPTTFRSWSPDLKAHFLTDVPIAAPADWPAQLSFSQDFRRILDPDQRCVCIVYDDGRSSQSNRFEADLVASIAWLLSGRMASQLVNERDANTGVIRPLANLAYSAEQFWQQALGVVTPHRAQQALVTGRLQELFRGRSNPELIRDAVDTVERFQGQERDVIVVTFALGDAAALQTRSCVRRPS